MTSLPIFYNFLIAMCVIPVCDNPILSKVISQSENSFMSYGMNIHYRPRGFMIWATAAAL